MQTTDAYPRKPKKLSTRLNIIVLLIFSSIIIGSILYHLVSQQVIKDTNRIIKKSYRSNKLSQISTDIAILGITAGMVIADKNPLTFDAIVRDSKRLINEIDEYAKIEQSEAGLHPKKQEEITSLLEAGNELKELLSFIEKSYPAGNVRAEEYQKNILSRIIKIDKDLLKIKAVHDEYMMESQNYLTKRMGNLSHLYLVLIFFGSICVVLSRYLLKRFVDDPISKLSAATNMIADGKFDERVKITSGDEIGLLGHSFNAMAQSIQEREARLTSCCNKVERLVEERTKDLESALHRLESTQTELIEAEKRITVGQIAAGVTHTIRNPLNSISINLQIINKCLASGRLDVEEIKKYTHIVLGEVNRINHLAEEFVKSSRMPAPHIIKGNIVELLDNVINLVKEEAKEKGVSVILEPDGNIPDICFDTGQMKDVFLNIITNSMQSIKNGNGWVKTSVSIEGSNLVVSISDNGCGILKECAAKVFTPFFTTKPDGIGLGLANSRQIVLAHGGNIRCNSEIGKGTTFYISLPADIMEDNVCACGTECG